MMRVCPKVTWQWPGERAEPGRKVSFPIYVTMNKDNLGRAEPGEMGLRLRIKNKNTLPGKNVHQILQESGPRQRAFWKVEEEWQQAAHSGGT